MVITCLLVDDENPDRELLANLLHTYCSSIQVKANAGSVSEAIRLLPKVKPDVVFLDIDMPTQNGFDLLKQIPDRNFLTVITTGHNQYGIQAVKAGAFDYLLKPIDVDELIETENKLIKALSKKNNTADKTISVYNQGEQVLIKVKDILYLKAEGSYTLIYTGTNKEILTSKNLQQLVEEINDNSVQRIHKSFAVNVSCISAYTPLGNEGIVTLHNQVKLKVGRKYKQELKEILP
ncbi:MAG: LytTR family DNA-binding domain-containing protein [Cyclobacteriaceae bacterium]|jgi:two-component system LytT family response regulator|nr:LytTR family DNA-binding domain-containing protein [Cytophagales bacterium]MCZ8329277.1 LytTR family DNA-binding domain-containing protein [Cyclobacteriaceae bacterium]